MASSSIFVAIIHLHSDDVVGVAKSDECGEVEAAGRDAVLIFADEFAVHPETSGLLEAFEFDEHLAILGAGGELEMFPIPGDAGVGVPVAATVADEVRV